jgi:hypothetical protein
MDPLSGTPQLWSFVFGLVFLASSVIAYRRRHCWSFVKGAIVEATPYGEEDGLFDCRIGYSVGIQHLVARLKLQLHPLELGDQIDLAYLIDDPNVYKIAAAVIDRKGSFPLICGGLVLILTAWF